MSVREEPMNCPHSEPGAVPGANGLVSCLDCAYSSTSKPHNLHRENTYAQDVMCVSFVISFIFGYVAGFGTNFTGFVINTVGGIAIIISTAYITNRFIVRDLSNKFSIRLYVYFKEDFFWYFTLGFIFGLVISLVSNMFNDSAVLGVVGGVIGGVVGGAIIARGCFYNNLLRLIA